MNLGVRPALLSVISSYLSNISMSVKFNGSTSKTYQMPGGPQGTLLGVLEYLAGRWSTGYTSWNTRVPIV